MTKVLFWILVEIVSMILILIIDFIQENMWINYVEKDNPQSSLFRKLNERIDEILGENR